MMNKKYKEQYRIMEEKQLLIRNELQPRQFVCNDKYKTFDHYTDAELYIKEHQDIFKGKTIKIEKVFIF